MCIRDRGGRGRGVLYIDREVRQRPADGDHSVSFGEGAGRGNTTVSPGEHTNLRATLKVVGTAAHDSGTRRTEWRLANRRAVRGKRVHELSRWTMLVCDLGDRI